MESLAKMKDEMSEKFSDVSLKVDICNNDYFYYIIIIIKVDSLNENITVSDTGGQEKFKRVEENFNALQTALRDIQSDNSNKIQKVADIRILLLQRITKISYLIMINWMSNISLSKF